MRARVRASKVRVSHMIYVVLAGAALMLIQDLVKDESESWLKGNGIWPRAGR